METLNHPAAPSMIEPENFTVLNHEESSFHRLHGETQQEFLERYLGYTDRIIDKMENFDTDEKGESVPADIIIFLDKSARPLAWFTREMWPHIVAPERVQQTEEPQIGKTRLRVKDMPQMRFLNIDRQPWRINPDLEISKNPDNFREPTKKDIDGLRAIFTERATRDGESIDAAPAQLDNKRVLIVDEVSDSGDTVLVAKRLLSKAFPSAKIKSIHWMNEYRLARDGEKQVLDKPVWYKSQIESGRGVFGQLSEGDEGANTSIRLTPESHQYLSTRPRIHRHFKDIDQSALKELQQAMLTASPAEKLRLEKDINHLLYENVDNDGLQLRKEIGRVVMMFASGELLPVPHDWDRPYYGGKPMDEYIVARQAYVASRT